MIDNLRLNPNKPIIVMSNLSFDHPLSNVELIELQNLLSSSVSVGQIYFKDDIDIETIETVKLFLEGLPNINDSIIEKYIMKDINAKEKEDLINMNFLNIDSWNISYSKEGNRYMVTSLSKYRKMEEWFKSSLLQLSDEDMSTLDKVCFLYDKVKLLEFDTNSKYDRIPEIIDEGRATSYGYNLVFKELLSLCGIPSVIGRISTEEDNYITLSIIKDEKYGIDGIYGFDPSMDTIFKDQYKNNLARKMNYNFFGITIKKLKKIYPKISMEGFIKILSSEDINEFNHWNKLYRIKREGMEIDKVVDKFDMSLVDIYQKTINTSEIPQDIVINIMIKSLEKYPNDIIDKELLTKAISDNYNIRNEELFTNKFVKQMYKVDI